MAEGTVLKFMQDENRPFNAQNVTDFMQKHGIKKPSVQRALDSLVEKKLLVVLEQNKTKIYHASQENMEVPSSEIIGKLELQVQQLQQAITEERQMVLVKEKELSLLLKQQTPEQIVDRVQKLEKECKAMESKLEPLRGAGNTVSESDLQQREQRYRDIFTQFRKRKHMFKNVWDQILECSEKRSKVLEEEVGIDTDESVALDSALLQKIFDGIKQPATLGVRRH